MSDTDNKVQRFKLKTYQRVIMMILVFIEIPLYLTYQLKLIHYILYPIPIFDSPTLSDSPYKQPAYFYNFCLYFSFFIQHAVMGAVSFKLGMLKIIPTYPLYERFMFTIISSAWYYLILHWAMPVSSESEIIFSIPTFIGQIMAIVSFSFVWITMWNFGGIGGAIPFKVKDILYGECLEFEKYTKISSEKLYDTGFYGFCRHPQLSATIGFMILASPVFTVDRIIFIVTNLVGTLIGIEFEERAAERKFERYKEYKKVVKYRLFPYII